VIHRYGVYPYLFSFPTRRSSDLKGFFPVVAFELEFYLLDPQTDWDDGMPAPVGAMAGPDRLRMYGLDDLAEHAGLFDMIRDAARSEEHTSELQSRQNLVCRLLLE